MTYDLNASLDSIGEVISSRAMRKVVDTCDKELRSAPGATLDAVCMAMRIRARAALDALIDGIEEEPWKGDALIDTCVSDIAAAGIAEATRR